MPLVGTGQFTIVDVNDGPISNLTPPSELTSVVADSMGGWTRLAGALSNSSIVNNQVGPNGEYPRILRVVGDGTIVAGWYTSWRYWFKVDISKAYVTYCWVRKRSATSANLYLGWTNSANFVDTLAGVNEPNPYFVQAQNPTIADKWYLCVGVIWPSGYGSGDTGLAGVYDPHTGVRVFDGNEFRHNTAATQQYLRIGFYNNTTAQASTDGYDFLPVGTYCMDGTQPTKEAIMNTVPSAMTAALSKETFVFSANNDGSVPVASYTGSGTQIRVYQGTAELTYDGTGTTKGTWTITSTTPTNITVGTIADSGIFATVGDHSGVATGTDTSSITYNISGTTLTGAPFTLVKTQTFAKAKAGANSVVIDLSNDNATVPANSDGSSPNFTGVSTTLSIFEGGVDTTSTWAITQALSSGLTGTVPVTTPVNRTFTPTGLTVDSGTATFTATKSGYANQSIVFTVSKAKAGSNGSPATVYSLRASQAVVKRLPSGAYSSGNLVVSLFSTTGTSAPAAYAGRFIIATSTDGTTYTNRYTSAANESSYSYAILAGVNFIRVSGYLTDGTTLVDQEIIPVADDGTAGINNATITLYQRAATAPTAPTGNYTYTFATQGISPATGSWTTAIPAGTSPLYVTVANASSNAATAIITFSAAVLFVQNGTQGGTGERGSKEFYASGSAWSDTTANTVITNQGLTKVLLDQVTISNGTNFAETRFWDGSVWATISQVINGNLLVNGTVGATKLSVTNLQAVSANIGTLRTTDTGARTEISDNVIKVFDTTGNIRIKIGNLAL